MTDYVREMRKLIGHRPLILCGASVVCIDGEGRILLGKRADNHLWAYAGGALEIDEYVEDCARRELYEEMGLTAEELTFFRVNCGPEAHYIYPNGDEVSNFEIVHLCRRWRGEPRPGDGEMTELRFFSPEEIDPEKLCPPNRRVVAELIKMLTEEKKK